MTRRHDIFTWCMPFTKATCRAEVQKAGLSAESFRGTCSVCERPYGERRGVSNTSSVVIQVVHLFPGCPFNLGRIYSSSFSTYFARMSFHCRCSSQSGYVFHEYLIRSLFLTYPAVVVIPELRQTKIETTIDGGNQSS